MLTGLEVMVRIRSRSGHCFCCAAFVPLTWGLLMAVKVVDNHSGKRQKLGRAYRVLTVCPSPGRGMEGKLLSPGSSEPAGRSLPVPWAWQKGWCWVWAGRGCTVKPCCASVLGDVWDKFNVKGGGMRHRGFCFLSSESNLLCYRAATNFLFRLMFK